MSAFQSLDPPTLLLAIAVFSSVLAALTLNLDRAMPDHAAELKRWGLAMLCSSAAFIGYFLRGHAPTWLTFVGPDFDSSK